MQQALTHIYADGSLLVLWGALLFHFILPIPSNIHPVTWWRKVALLIASKVNLTQSSYQHKKTAGFMAWSLMMLPCIAVLIACQQLVWQPQLFELALLLIALDWKASHHFAHNITQQIAQENKDTARQQLSLYVNRQTERLSLLGLGKASAETMIMATARQVIGVLFWYAISGAIGALLYRLISELARTWSPSRTTFMPFGQFASYIFLILDFLPIRLFSLFILTGKNAYAIASKWRADYKLWPQTSSGWLLSACGHKLQLSLGGPAIYDHNKVLRAKIGGRIAPSALHLAQLHSLLTQRVLIWLFLQSSLLTVIHQGI